MAAVALVASATGTVKATGQSPASTAAALPAGKSGTLQEVTVTAKRAKLAPKVRKFVDQISVPENGGNAGLARWGVPPVCPLVSGLPRQDGEFILERLSEIARAAAVPLAGEHCRPNLYILATLQPEDLLRGMEQRNRGFTFGYDTSFYPPTETPAGVVDEFIKTPRVVRVWYNSNGKDDWGNPLHYCGGGTKKMACDLNPRLPGCIPPPPYDPTQAVLCSPGAPGGTRLAFDTVWTFSRVFVIVDTKRLQGVKLGQLADYVAMVGFAKLKPDARLGDAPTILKLFEGAPQAAPPGMTDWDQSFLKSLYATEQKSKLQRGEIARAMVREIAH
jgi:hypothetical protein